MKKILLCSLMLSIVSFNTFAGRGTGKGQVRYTGKRFDVKKPTTELKVASNKETDASIAKLNTIGSVFCLIVGGTLLTTSLISAHLNPEKNGPHVYFFTNLGVCISLPPLVYLLKK